MANLLKFVSLVFVAFASACQSTSSESLDDLVKQIEKITQQNGFSKVIDCESAELCFTQDTRLDYKAVTPDNLDYLPEQFFVMNDHLTSIGLDTFMGNTKSGFSSSPLVWHSDPRTIAKIYTLNGYFLFEDKKNKCEVLSHFSLEVRYDETIEFEGLRMVTSPRKIDRDYPILHRINFDKSACDSILATNKLQN